MQLYDGLPIITNKIKEEEMKGIPHHLLGLVSLDEPTWTVDQFIKHAAAIVGTAMCISLLLLTNQD